MHTFTVVCPPKMGVFEAMCGTRAQIMYIMQCRALNMRMKASCIDSLPLRARVHARAHAHTHTHTHTRARARTRTHTHCSTTPPPFPSRPLSLTLIGTRSAWVCWYSTLSGSQHTSLVSVRMCVCVAWWWWCVCVWGGTYWPLWRG